MSIYEDLKRNADDVICVDRTGTIISVYLKGNVRVLFEFGTINQARRKFREYRRELEGVKV